MVKKTEQYERPILTVDVVMFTLIDDQLYVYLPPRPTNDRSDNPFPGIPSLVGAYIRTKEDKDTHAAARRAVTQKVGIEPPYLEQLAMWSGPDRDPRGWSATMAYISMVKTEGLSADIIKDFHPVDRLPEQIGFDHRDIVFWAVQRLRNKASYSTLPLYLMPPTFTLLELQKVYEAMMGQSVDKTKFRRKMVVGFDQLEIIEPTGEKKHRTGAWGKASELYRPVDQKLWLFNEMIAA